MSSSPPSSRYATARLAAARPPPTMTMPLSTRRSFHAGRRRLPLNRSNEAFRCFSPRSTLDCHMPVRLVLGLVGACAVVVLAAAHAAERTGTTGPDRLVGTSKADTIFALGGNDRIEGRAGPDFLHGGPGRDMVLGEAGNDRIAVDFDRARDTVSCGPGQDLVNAELADVVAGDCEIVSRQLSARRAAPVRGAARDAGRAGQPVASARPSSRPSSRVGWSREARPGSAGRPRPMRGRHGARASSSVSPTGPATRWSRTTACAARG